MGKTFLIFIILTHCCIFRANTVYAQLEGRAVIRMQLEDSVTGKPVPYATISIYREKEKDASRYGVSDANGYVEIVKMEQGKFLVAIEHLSYNTVLKYIAIGKEKTVNLGKVILIERSIRLDDAVVRGEAAILQKGDTTEYNAKFFNPAPTDYLGDLLKKMPGLEIYGSNVYFKGVKVESLTVEGRPFFMSDNSIALENLPAYAVKKVSVFKRNRSLITGIEDIANAPLQLNIVLKDGMKSGVIGNLTPGYGTESRYLAKGLLGRFGSKATTALIVSANNVSKDAGNSSMYNFSPIGTMMPQLPSSIDGYAGDIKTILSGIDYARSKSNSPDLTYLNATYRHGNKFLSTLKKRETSLSDGILTDMSDGVSTDLSDEANISFRQNNTINRNEKGKRNIYAYFSSNLNYRKEKIGNRESFSSTRKGTINNNNSGETSNIGNIQETGINTLFHLSTIKSKARLYFSGMSTGLVYSHTEKDYRNYSVTRFDEGIPQLIDQKKEERGDRLQFNTSISFELLQFLTLTYSLRYQYATQDVKAWNFNNQTGTYEDLSDNSTGYLKNNTVEQDVEIKKIITIYNEGQNNHWTLSARATPIWMGTTNKGNPVVYRKWSFIPLLSYSSRRLYFKYTGQIQHPTLQQLQPIANNDNPLYIYMGNIDLHPAYTHILDFWQEIGIFHFGADGTTTRNKIIQKQTIDSAGITRTLPINANGDYNARLSVSVTGLSIGRRITWGTSLSGRYLKGTGYANQGKYTSNSLTANGSLGLTYRRTFFEASIGGSVMYSNTRFSTNTLDSESTWTNGAYASMNWALPYDFNIISKYSYTYYIGFKSDNTPSSVWDVELCKTAFKKRVVFSLKGYDLLNQTKNLKVTYADNYIEENTVNMLRRYVMFSISFKFGKF